MLSEIMKKHLKVENHKHRPKNFNQSVNETYSNYVNRVNSGKGWEAVTCCPICKSENSIFELSKFDIDMLKCLDCSHRYHNKFPVDIDDVYNDRKYKNKSAGYWVEGEYEYRKNRFGVERVKILEDYLGSIKNKFLLDVGCGAGYFLDAALDAGANCDGLEPSEDVRIDTSKKIGINISDKAIEDFNPKNNYDILTSFDVIEHVKNPMSMFSHMNRLLKKNGVLLLFTPNFDSFGVKVARENSNLVSPGAHLMLFTEKSMKLALEKSGFEIVYYKTYGLDIDDILSLKKVNDKNENIFLNDWKEELQAIIDAANCGTYMRVIAKKI